jgi:heat shock protein HslJ
MWIGRQVHVNKTWLTLALVLLLSFACAACTQISRQGTASELEGTSWQLVRFQGGDGATLTPDERSKYTISFAADGRVSARIDCNRGIGAWKSAGPNQLEFGPLATTRAMCPPGSLHDQIVKQWNYVRSYIIKNNHLFLSLMADGGIYEFEPIAVPRSASAAPPRAAPRVTIESGILEGAGKDSAVRTGELAERFHP